MQLVPATVELFTELTSRQGTLAPVDSFAPPLRIHYCPVCRREFLRVAMGHCFDLWLETTEPSLPWIQLKIDLRDFFQITGALRRHSCRAAFLRSEVGL
jgi:hypothetical protein